MSSIGIITGLSELTSNFFVSKIEEIAKFYHYKILSTPASANNVIKLLSNTDLLFHFLKNIIDSNNLSLSTILTIPCNSVHIVSNKLQSTFPGFLPIHETTINNLEKRVKKKSVLLLATSMTIQSGIYQNLLSEKGFQWLTPSRNEQEWLDSLIFTQLVKNQFSKSHYQELINMQYRFLEKGQVEHVVLACTDLCYLNQKYGTYMPWQTDSLDSLVAAIVGKMEV